MSEFDKNNDFKTPEGYFGKFNGKLMEKLSEKESVLDHMDGQRDEGFSVPKDYFKNLNETVIAKIDEKAGKVVQLSPYRRYYYAAASVAAVLAVILSIRLMPNKAPTFESLVSSDIESYFEDYEFDFTDDELAELLPIQEVGINDILNQEINQQRIIDYLDDNIEDLHELNSVYDEE